MAVFVITSRRQFLGKGPPQLLALMDAEASNTDVCDASGRTGSGGESDTNASSSRTGEHEMKHDYMRQHRCGRVERLPRSISTTPPGSPRRDTGVEEDGLHPTGVVGNLSVALLLRQSSNCDGYNTQGTETAGAAESAAHDGEK